MKLLSHGPEPCASANSAISANYLVFLWQPRRVTVCGTRNQRFRPLHLLTLTVSATGSARVRSCQFRHIRILFSFCNGSRARVTVCGARNQRFRPLHLLTLAVSATGSARVRSCQFRHIRKLICDLNIIPQFF